MSGTGVAQIARGTRADERSTRIGGGGGMRARHGTDMPSRGFSRDDDDDDVVVVAIVHPHRLVIEGSRSILGHRRRLYRRQWR